MIKALFFDLDGTLLTSARKLSDKTKTALKACNENGIKIFVATARPPLIGKMLCFAPEELEIIKDGGVFYNGGCICCNNQKIYTTIPEEAVKISIEIIKACEEANIALQFVHEKHSFRYGLTDANYSLWGVNEDELISFQDISYFDVVKIVVFSSCDKLAGLQNELLAAAGASTNVYLTGSGVLRSIEIVSKAINKKLAVDRVTELCNLNRCEVAVFGDDYNDIEMLKGFMYSVAMGNASNEVKCCARFVTLGNDEEGIHYALSNILKLI
ncbi:MAG: HAD family hydrolase [Clostridiaceae bacterium]